MGLQGQVSPADAVNSHKAAIMSRKESEIMVLPVQGPSGSLALL